MNDRLPISVCLSRRRFLAAGATAVGALCFERPARADGDEKEVDAALARALEFLAREQRPSGAWQTAAYGESTAATSLALMAFMAAGFVPAEGPYAQNMARGIRWVLDHQLPNGLLVHRSAHGPMYDHGISTLMLAEIVGMIEAPLADDVRKVLESAVRLILKAQNVAKDARSAGGWRYQPSSNDSDLSVTGWQLLALRAAKNDGCDVPADHIDRAVEYVKRCAVRDAGGQSGGFAYQPSDGTSATRTGTGITCLEVCGAHHAAESVGGAEYLLQRPLHLEEQFFYYGAYYCSVGMFKMGGKYWDETKATLSRLLLTEQQFDGRWSARSNSERPAGDIYATSLAVLALAVEYQYLPIYQR